MPRLSGKQADGTSSCCERWVGAGAPPQPSCALAPGCCSVGSFEGPVVGQAGRGRSGGCAEEAGGDNEMSRTKLKLCFATASLHNSVLEEEVKAWGAVMGTWHNAAVGMTCFFSFFLVTKPNPFHLPMVTLNLQLRVWQCGWA